MPKRPASQQHEQHRTLLDRIAARYEQLETRLEELESQIGEGPAVRRPPADPLTASPDDASEFAKPPKRKRPRKPR